MKILLKRAYSPAAKADGFRILADRLWPRGVSKDAAHLDLWLKEIAPTTELRKWFNHEPAKWPEFRKRYFRELDGNAEAVQTLRGHAKKGTVTLVYSAHDTEHNQAVALKEYLESRAPRRAS
ncbi:MAG TPA: DUF488 domain-containing protein [Gemmatimonadaceae bacterium]|jgi:uncharacterized protein YeaO (DUF488 family)|nr:DUF488 domain-containing protein [Gemmatimonadaceae bacterium]